MPTGLYQWAVFVVAVAILLVVISGVAGWVSGRAKSLIWGGLVGGLYRAVITPSKEAEAALATRQRQVEELHRALDDLSHAVFQRDDAVAEAAAARIRRYCSGTKDTLNSVLQRMRGPMPGFNQALMQKLLADVGEAAAPCLEVKAK